MTDDLSARVVAAIEETERAANAVTGKPYSWYVTQVSLAHEGSYPVSSQDVFRTALAKRFDKRAVLRRCEADRRVWRRHEPAVIDGRETPTRVTCAYCSRGRVVGAPWPCPDFADLADAYDITAEEG